MSAMPVGSAMPLCSLYNRGVKERMRIGIDLGGTKIEGLALAVDGQELARLRVATPRGDYDATVRSIADLVSHLEAATGLPASVGVGIPGTIVAATGLVKNANSTWLNGRPLAQDLAVALSREVRCANDANCMTLSEAVDGAAAGAAVVFGVILGTGCGGGIAVRGAVHSGRNGLAGEWGHMPLPWASDGETPGPACYCGRHGCMEQWVSGTGLVRDYEQVNGHAVRGEQIVAAALAGDAQAQAALERWADRLARGLAIVVDVLDPDVIVFGGGLSRVAGLYPAVSARLGGYCFGGGAETPLVPALHGDSSGVRGAAWLWSQGEL